MRIINIFTNGRISQIMMLCTVLMLLGGCTESEEMAVNESKRAVAFTADAEQPTRSSSTFTANKKIPAGQSIGIYAYLHRNSTWSSSAQPNFMFHQQATYTEEDETFRYTPLKYWPNDSRDKVSFIAYFPYCSDGASYPANATGLQPLMTNDGTGLPTFRFTVKDNANEQVDFLVSDLLPNLPNGTSAVSPSQTNNREGLTINDRVHFLFKHMTSKVEFRVVVDPAIRRDIAHFQLNSLTITNIYKDGLLSPNPPSGTTYEWTEQTARHGTDPAYSYPCTTYEPYLLMPQTIRDDAMINLDYEITFKSDSTTYKYVDGKAVPVADYTYKKSNASLQLNTLKQTSNNTALKIWKPNHYYVYTIRLRANRIDFTGEVVDWGEFYEWPEPEP